MRFQKMRLLSRGGLCVECAIWRVSWCLNFSSIFFHEKNIFSTTFFRWSKTNIFYFSGASFKKKSWKLIEINKVETEKVRLFYGLIDKIHASFVTFAST